MADYFSDNIRPQHGERYFDAETMDVMVYDKTIGRWFKESYGAKLEKSALPVSQVYIPGLTHSKAASGMISKEEVLVEFNKVNDNQRLYPHPNPPEKPITDFDFDEEDFEL